MNRMFWILITILLGKSVALNGQTFHGEDIIYPFRTLDSCVTNSINDTIDIIYIYATWCEPCMKSVPALTISKASRGEHPVRWWMVSLDEYEAKWFNFLDKTATGWRHVRVFDAVDKKTFNKFYSGNGIPDIVIFKQGVELKRAASWIEIERHLDKKLSKMVY